MSRCAYIFLDEAGNLDFSHKGTRYFVLTSVSMRRPFPIYEALSDYKHDCLEYGLDMEYFHCADDNRHVRNGVFNLIGEYLGGMRNMRIDALVVEKRKTGPALQEDRRFYPKMLGYLLKFVLPKELKADAEEVIVITDKLPVNRKRQAVEKGIRLALTEMLPKGMKYRILHHASRSHYGLQLADYCCWAVFQKWSRNKTHFYDRIKRSVRSEFDIFRIGNRYYY